MLPGETTSGVIWLNLWVVHRGEVRLDMGAKIENAEELEKGNHSNAFNHAGDLYEFVGIRSLMSAMPNGASAEVSPEWWWLK